MDRILGQDLERNGDGPTKLEAEEFRLIQARRFKALTGEDPPAGLPDSDVKEQHERDLVGLAFSGGGIRSATFGLGVLQGLADLNLLKFVDYLSTVSGGGYIGSWFAAWVKREGSLENVQKQLRPDRTKQATALRGFHDENTKRNEHDVAEAEPEPIFHLRQYSNYLSPRLSIFSSDSWSLVAIYLRNLLSNLLVVLPTILFVFLLVRALAGGFAYWSETPPVLGNFFGAPALMMLCLAFAMITFSVNEIARKRKIGGDDLSLGTGWFSTIVGLLSVSAVMLTWVLVPGTTPLTLINELPAKLTPLENEAEWVGRFTNWYRDQVSKTCRWNLKEFVWSDVLKFALLFGVLHGLLSLSRGLKWHWVTIATQVVISMFTSWCIFIRPEGDWQPYEILVVLLIVVSSVWRVWTLSDRSVGRFRRYWPIACGVLSGLIGGGLLYLVLHQILWKWAMNPAVVVTVGPPLLLAVFSIGVICEVAMLGTIADEPEREWWSQLLAWMMILSAGWLIVCGLSLFGDLVLRWLNGYLRTGLAAGWLMTALGGLWAARSSRTSGEKSDSSLEVISAAAPFVFLAGLLCLMSSLTHFLMIVQEETLAKYETRIVLNVPQISNPKPEANPLEIVDESTHKSGVEAAQIQTVQRRKTVLTRDEWGIQKAKHWFAISNPAGLRLFWMLVVTSGIAMIMSWRVDINEFSLNAMYANRLTRCYLGASRRKKSKQAARTDSWGSGSGSAAHTHGPPWRPNRVTGFDPQDDLNLSDFQIGYSLEAKIRKNKVRQAEIKLELAKTNADLLIQVNREWPDRHANRTVRAKINALDDLLLLFAKRVSLQEKLTSLEVDLPKKEAKFAELTERLKQRDSVAQNQNEMPYWGPLPLINTALNLVGGDELAWQERMAESFVLSPLACGSNSLGYCRTDHYAGGLKLGRAVAISGAAANPNMGYHSSPATTAMMTLFNVRLGWWLPNPREEFSWKLSCPAFLLKWLAIELFSRTSSSRKFLNISDGGHFENLGVYELVRRRCRCIIVSDAGADPKFEFADLAGLIRKCRTDFGIDIEIDLTQLRPKKETGKTTWHCAIGTIRYDQVEPTAPVGTLIYIKPSLTGHESSDIQNYVASHPDFPHQPTLDQFFNESQFESYRALGFHIAQEVFGSVTARLRKNGNLDQADPTDTVAGRHADFVKNFAYWMQKQWFPEPLELEQKLLESVKPFVEFHQDLRREEALQSLSEDLYPETFLRLKKIDAQLTTVVRTTTETQREGGPVRREDLHIACQMLQVMENAWLGMSFKEFHSHPLNAGWMNLFQRWGNTQLLRRSWPLLCHEFSREFVQFCERELALRRKFSELQLLEVQTSEERELLFSEFRQEWDEEANPTSVSNKPTKPKRGLSDLYQAAFSFPDEAEHGKLTRHRAFWVIRVGYPVESSNGEQTMSPGFIAGVIGLCKLTGHERRGKYVEKKFLPETAGNEYELVVWVRPAFRQQGIGQRLVEQFFHGIVLDEDGKNPKLLKEMKQPYDQQCVVTLFYAKSGWAGAGDKLAKRLWLSYFSFYDFRRPQPTQRWKRDSDYEILHGELTY